MGLFLARCSLRNRRLLHVCLNRRDHELNLNRVPARGTRHGYSSVRLHGLRFGSYLDISRKITFNPRSRGGIFDRGGRARLPVR